MQRRPFIKLLGASLSSLPFAPVIEESLTTAVPWQKWLEQLTSACQVEAGRTLLSTNQLPPVPAAVQSGEFTKTGSPIYFYQQRNYCFQVFEKRHAIVGVLDLLIPFWKLNLTGEWSKVACLSLYDLKALAEATAQFSADPAGYLLPLKQTYPNQYLSAKGQVELISYLQIDGNVSTNFRVMNGTEVIGASGSFYS